MSNVGHLGVDQNVGKERNKVLPFRLGTLEKLLDPVQLSNVQALGGTNISDRSKVTTVISLIHGDDVRIKSAKSKLLFVVWDSKCNLEYLKSRIKHLCVLALKGYM